MLKRILSASSLLAVAAWGSVATAQPPPASAADAAFDRGRAAMSKGDYAAACTQFGESYRLDPAVGTQLNMSLCEEKLGKLVAAQTDLTEVLARLPKGDSRVAVAETRLEALKKRVPTVIVTVDDSSAGARVSQDGTELGPDAVGRPLPLDPGAHAFVVSAPGRAGSRHDVLLKEGDHIALSLAVGSPSQTAVAPASAPAASTQAASTAPAMHDSRAPVNGRRVLGIGALALGGAGLVTGAVTGILTAGAASTYNEHCKNGECDDDGKSAASRGKVLEVVSPIALGAGALCAGLGAYLLLTSKSSSSRTGVIVTPQLSARDVGVGLFGSF